MSVNKLVSDLTDQTREAGNQLRDGLISIRDHIAKLNRRKEEITTRPPEEKVALARMADWVNAQSAHARSEVPAASRFTDAVHHPVEYFKFDKMAVAYLSGSIKEVLSAEIRALYKKSPGISDDDRASQLEALDDDLLDAELAEESIIRAAEAMGFHMTRRANADPRAVLAHKKDLP